MKRPRIVRIELSQTEDASGATCDVPDRVLVEVDAVALAWIGKVCGRWMPTCPESSHFYEASCLVWDRYMDRGLDDVNTSSYEHR